jgi:proline dehydrogenase
MTRTFKKAVWACWMIVARRAARTYIAGTHLDQALGAVRWLAERELACTLGFWDADGDAPVRVAEAYQAALEALAREGLDGYVSVKAPSLRFSRELVLDLLTRGRARDVAIHFDSLGPETADRTFGLLRELRDCCPQLGCTLPSRWARSVGDVDTAADLRLRVRVVKGQWEDAGVDGLDPRRNYLAIIDRLAGRVPHVAVATHDVPLAVEALRRLQAAATPCELELLYGLPMRRAARAGARAGVRVRVYVPYGQAYLPYCLSQAQQNPRIFWWALRDTLLARNLYLLRARRGPAGIDAAGNGRHGEAGLRPRTD